MPKTHPAFWRSLVGTLVLSFLPHAASAVQHEVRVLMDLDDDPGTGCLVNTVAGPFDGVEQILISTVETSSPPEAGMVTDVATSDCIDAMTDTFSAPSSFDGGWPVGIANGVGGRDVVETYFPLAASVVAAPSIVRLGVVVTDELGGERALLTTDGTRGGPDIILDLRSVLEIPTLGEWGLLLLVLLLAGASLLVLGRRGTAALVVCIVVLGAGVAWAAGTLDGLTDDWTSGDQLATDGLVLFGKAGAGSLCFRVDVDLLFNQPPTITAIADQTIPEDGTTGALAFTIGDPESPANTLTVTATSSNQVLVPDANLTLGGAGANRTITVTPAANQNGFTDVTVTVQDPNGATASTTFRVTVTSANDPPTITAIADQMILEDGTTGPLAFTVGDVETPVASLVVTASSNDTTIIPNANLVLGGAGANRTITVTPAADQNGGPVTITLTVMDTDGGSAPEQFDVTVTPVNDAPSFTLAGDVMSDEDAGLQTVMNQVTAISPGPANESGQTVTLSVSNDNNALFSAQPAIDASGTLTYTSAPNANGMATVTVQAMDDGGTANGGVDMSAAQMFTITVNAVNDPPTVVGETFDVAAGNFDPAIGNTTLQFADTETVTEPHVFISGDLLANDSDSDGPAALSITAFDATGTNGGTVSVNTTTGELIYVPPLGFEGTDTFTYTVSDGAASAMATVTIEVSGMVWYLDNQTDGTGDDGRSGSPFDTIAQLEAQNGGGAADDPEAGDIIFVHEGSGTYDAGVGDLDGIHLLDQQKLWGEGIGLTVLGKTLVAAGNRPVIDNTNTGGDGVSVLANAANGDRTGIEIRGLTLNGDDNSVSVTSADAAVVDVTLSDDLIDNAGGNGLDLNPGSSGDFTVAVSNNTWTTMSPTGNGLDLTTGAGNSANVMLAVDTNTNITGGGAGVNVNGTAGTGTVYVTSLSGNSVNGATAANGMVFDTVVFDADPSDTNFTGDTVAGGMTVVGSGADRVSGSGVVLDTVTGDLSFSSLTVFNDAGAGLRVIGGGPFNAGAGTGFRISASGGAIDTVNGPAVDIDPATLGLILASVTSQTTAGVTPHGIRLDAVGGSFQVTGTTSIGASGGGSLTTGILANNSSASITFAGQTTVGPTTGSGIALTSLTGPFTVMSSMSSVSGAGGPAIDVDQGTGNVTYNGSVTNTAGRSVEITNHGGPGGGSTIVLAGSITDTGTGVFLDNNDQGAGGTVINLTGALNLTTGGSNAFTASNGGTVNVTNPSNNNLAATTTGTGVVITDTSIGGSGVKFTTVNVGDGNAAAPNAANGILLTNVGAGAFTATGGAIQNVTTRGLDVSGGTGNVTVGASISTTATGRSLEVTGHTGGTVAVSSAIDDNGLGVNLSSNTGATINVTGSMAIDTVGANTGFNATGGGTVNVMTGTNDVDTSAGTGIGVNIANTTIGASGVTFRSVSANGASSGIVLNTTGPDAFEVTGEGASDPTVVVGTRGRTLNLSGGGTMSGFNTGGVIRNTTGDGVSLTATNAILRNLAIGDTTATVGQAADGTVNVGDDGVSVTASPSLVLDNVLISRTATHGIRAVATSNVTIVNTEVLNAGTAIDEDGADFLELLGLSSISNSIFDGMSSRGIDVQDDTKTSNMATDNLLVINTQVTNSDSITGENGIRFRSLGSSNFDLMVLDSMIATVEGNGIGVFSNGTNAADPSNVHLGVQRTSIIGTGAPNITVPTAIQVNPAFEGNATFDIMDNNPGIGGGFSGIPTAGIIIKNDSNGLLRGTIANNVVGSAGEGAFVVADGAIGMTSVTGDVQITVIGNVFTSTGAHGMSFSAQDGAVSLEAKIGNNTTTAGGPAFSFQNGIFMDVQTGTACFNLATAAGAGNNVATGAGSGEGIFLQKTGGSVDFQGFGGGNDVAAATFLNNNNTSNPAASVFSGDTVGTGACSNTP